MSKEIEIDAVAAKKESGAATRKKRAAGRPKLQNAAGQVLEEKSQQIAESLGESAAKGSVQSARLLLELSEMRTEAKKKRSPESSLARQWSREPEWKDS